MNCPFEMDDGAYVLGGLSEPERSEFERHLASCVSCASNVEALAGMPSLLALVAVGGGDVGAGSVQAPPSGPLSGPASGQPAVGGPPSTLLPRIVAAARAERRAAAWRRRLAGGAVAAALVVLAVASGAVVGDYVGDRRVSDALAGAQGAASASASASASWRRIQMIPVTAGSSVTGWVSLSGDSGGTVVHVDCRYTRERSPGEPADAYGTVTYQLFVISRDGGQEPISSWTAGPGEAREVAAATRLRPPDIARIEIRRLDGAPVLTVAV